MISVMSNRLNPRTWLSAGGIRHNETSQPPCSLASCSRPQSLWQRLRSRHRPSGTLLQGAFYCQPQCLETALIGLLSHHRVMPLSPQPPNRIPLGLLMVARGKLTHVEVRAALEAQRRAHYGKIGEWIEKLGFATEREVTASLALQWGCPVATSIDLSTVHSLGNIPLPILETFQMLPLNYTSSRNTLYLAFGERVDHAALYAIEKILACRTQPCVAARKSIARQIESLAQYPRPADVEFGPMNDLAEMARIAASYTTRLSPTEVRLSRIGRFIWLRLDVRPNFRPTTQPRTSSATTNLVFRLSTDGPPPQTM
jgi:Type II secretion system (T2SS), protein E, N-terminal domain